MSYGLFVLSILERIDHVKRTVYCTLNQDVIGTHYIMSFTSELTNYVFIMQQLVTELWSTIQGLDGKTATLAGKHSKCYVVHQSILIEKKHIDSLVQDCSNSIANTLELLQSCTKTLTDGVLLVL